jgi:hypothetical protein
MVKKAEEAKWRAHIEERMPLASFAIEPPRRSH